jgi:tRNA G18 (ribose-2'-O)-methylase SpoU
MGTALQLPFATLDPWPSALEVVKNAGFTVIALTPASSATPIQNIQPPPKVALLLGAEGPGLTPEALAAADVTAQIPMDPAVDSLNVVSAAGIALHRLAPTVESPFRAMF